MKDIQVKDLETERLILKKPSMKEQYNLWEILNIKEVNQYYMPTPSRFNGDRKAFLDKLSDWDKQKQYYEIKINNLNEDSDKFTWSIFLKNGEVIGQMTVQPNDHEDDNPDKIKGIRNVGWYINPKYQKQGLAFEAASAVLEFMFNEVEIDAIRTSAAAINPASWKLMEKLGMIRTGEKDSSYLDANEKPLLGYRYEITKEMYDNKNNNT